MFKGEQMHRIADHLKPYPLGWKAKLGFLVPSHDTGYGSYEFQVMSPDGVVPLETRVPGRTISLDHLNGMVDNALSAAEMLADARPDVIDFLPTAPCFVMGVDREDALTQAITTSTGIRATAGGRAVAEALRFLGAHKIIMYTPYRPELQGLTDTYFADQGFEVLGSMNLQFEDPENMNRMSPHEILSDIVRLRKQHPDAEGVFVVGGCFRTLEIVEPLEQMIGIPVVGTQQANMFACLRICEVDDELQGFGRLLSAPRLGTSAREESLSLIG
jgi:maleate isomerase